MRTSRRIIIRIIVTVAVAVILSKLKLLGVLNVNALEVYTSEISNLCAFNMTGNEIGCPELSYYYYHGNLPTKGWSYNSQNNFSAMAFQVPEVPNFRNKYFIASGVFITGATTHGNNIKMYARNWANDFTVCDITQTNTPVIGDPNVYTFSCNVFATSAGPLRFFIEGPFDVSPYTTFELSRITYIYDNDILLAQNTTNSILNEIKSQLQTTNQKLDNTNNTLNSILSGITASNGIQQQIQNNTKETNDLIKNDDTTEASNQGGSFFNDFSSNVPQGLSGIISSPLRLITSLSSSTCSPLTFPLPFVNQNATLPCMSTIYSQFPEFYSIWQIITTGLIGYWVCVNLFRVVKGLQDPGNDRIEVLDL